MSTANVSNGYKCLWHLARKLKSHFRASAANAKEARKGGEECLGSLPPALHAAKLQNHLLRKKTFKIKSRLFTSAVSIMVYFRLKGNTECRFHYSHIYCEPGRMRPSWGWGTSLLLIFSFCLYNFNCESPQRTRTVSIPPIKSSHGCSRSCCSAPVSPVNYEDADVSYSEESLQPQRK